jgi:hypothetical protein
MSDPVLQRLPSRILTGLNNRVRELEFRHLRSTLMRLMRVHNAVCKSKRALLRSIAKLTKDSESSASAIALGCEFENDGTREAEETQRRPLHVSGPG